MEIRDIDKEFENIMDLVERIFQAADDDDRLDLANRLIYFTLLHGCYDRIEALGLLEWTKQEVLSASDEFMDGMGPNGAEGQGEPN